MQVSGCLCILFSSDLVWCENYIVKAIETNNEDAFAPCCRITLEIMTLQPRCEDVETAEGVAITVTGVAQVRPQSSVFTVSTFFICKEMSPKIKQADSTTNIFYSINVSHDRCYS